jgi:hypothetical protein
MTNSRSSANEPEKESKIQQKSLSSPQGSLPAQESVDKHHKHKGLYRNKQNPRQPPINSTLTSTIEIDTKQKRAGSSRPYLLKNQYFAHYYSLFSILCMRFAGKVSN